MPIAVDATTTSAIADMGLDDPVSVAHTCTGSDRYLLLGVCLGLGDDTRTMSVGPAYNGVSMTEIINSTSSPNAQCRVHVFGLIAPATGANNLTFTMSAGGDGRTVVIIRSYTGVHQTTPTGTAASATGDGGTTTVDVSSAADELVSDFLAAWGSGTPAVGAGQTERANLLNVYSSGLGASSDEAGAGTVTMSWSSMPGNDWALAAVPLKPVSGGGGSPALDDSDGFMLTTIQMPLTAVRLY